MQSRPPNPYATLGLHSKCTPEQIRDAYRILAKKFHPDLNPNSAEAVAQTQALNQAYQVLSDPERRRAYDESVLAARSSKKSSHPGESDNDPDSSLKPRRRPQSAAKITQDVALRLEEFFRGTTLEVQVKDPGNPDGPETYPLIVPPETPPGTRFRIRREGYFAGGQVIVRVMARTDFRFKVRGSDLRCDLRINAQRAALGGMESVRGAQGQFVKVPVPKNIARGEEVRVQGEGLPRARGGRGDLLVRIVYTPSVRIVRAPR